MKQERNMPCGGTAKAAFLFHLCIHTPTFCLAPSLYLSLSVSFFLAHCHPVAVYHQVPSLSLSPDPTTYLPLTNSKNNYRLIEALPKMFKVC